MIFDGKTFAREIEQKIKTDVEKLGKKIKIVSILVGADPASALYTKLKKAAAERVGINFEVVKIASEKLHVESLSSVIEEIGEREDVTGVMVQLPIIGLQGLALKEVLSAIPLNKDVDGLRWEESGIIPATVRAVLTIIDTIAKDKTKFVVLGARGAVGRPLVHFLGERGVVVSEVEWDTPLPFGRLPKGEVVISCVGKAGLVIGEMVSDGLIAIDVGMSLPAQAGEVDGKVVGDMTREVYDKCSVAVPVPRGVGPVTIACLLKNVVEIYDVHTGGTR